MKAITGDEAIAAIETIPVYVREVVTPPKYKVGDRIRSATLTPSGHTRFPRYARDKDGVILEHYQAQVFPDSLVSTNDENPQHVYLVKFTAKELWGETAGNFSVNLSLFEDYIAGQCAPEAS